MYYEVFSCDGDFNEQYIYQLMVDKFSTTNIPSEWYLMNAIYYYNMLIDGSLAEKFMKFVSTYYPDFQWMNKKLGDVQKIVDFEIFFNSRHYYKMYSCGIVDGALLVDGTSLELTDYERKLLNRALYFGNIVKDFAIRYLGYSIINHEQKTILTSVTDDERISRLVSEGYAMEVNDRVDYVVRNEKKKYYGEFVVTTIPFAMLPKSTMAL